MENKLDLGISDEVMKELNITSLEEYQKVVMSDKKQNNLKAKSKADAQLVKKSNTQIKAEKKRKEHVLMKRRKNEARNAILESLAKHNNEEVQKKLEIMESSRILALGKRKGSKELSHRLSVDSRNERKVSNVHLEESEDSIDSDDSKENLNTTEEKPKLNTKEEELDQEMRTDEELTTSQKIENTIKNMTGSSDSWMILEPTLRENILKEIRTYRASTNIDEDLAIEQDLFKDLEIPSKDKTLVINRKDEISQSRLELPILKYEQEIMDTINHSLVTIISGETGSGKSTQIPQFLYEYGYSKTLGHIAITQPRRLAAISLSSRVAEELNLKYGHEVGYQVRYDSQHCSESTEIKYMTDGIMLKELESDSFLFRYSVVIIDEAHERSINTDILIGLLSRVIRFRYLMSKNSIKINNKIVKPLRLIIMSATMSVDEFMNEKIFQTVPKYIKVEARQFPVAVHHLKKTPEDYLEETFKVICKIHRKLPQGGILVFLTGKKEINEMCDKLKLEFSRKNWGEKLDQSDEIVNNVESIEEVKEEEDIRQFNILDEPEMKETNKSLNEQALDIEQGDDELSPVYNEAIILPLYSSLPQEEQNKVFQKNLGNKRLIVISTNVAETSLTIPNVKYVVDCGKEKKRLLNHGLSFSTFTIEFISQASAEQRTGRAGRTAPGHCYRIYSAGLYGKMKQFNDPQILTTQLDQTVLYLKTLKIRDINNFPFITFPNRSLIEKSIRHLIVLGAIEEEEKEKNILTKISLVGLKDCKIEDKYKITEVGTLMSKFPVPPRYARMIIVGKRFGLILHSLFLAATLSQESIFTQPTSINLKKILQVPVLNPSSDAVTHLNLVLEAFNQFTFDSKKSFYQYAEKYHLNVKCLKEIFELVNQLIRISTLVFKGTENHNLNLIKSRIQLPSAHQQKILIQVLVCGLIDNIAKKRVIYDSVGNESEKIVKKKVIYECNESHEECQISKNSVVEDSELLCYKEIIKDQKANLICNTVVHPEWIFNLGGDLVSYNFEKFVKEPFYLEGKIYCLIDIKYGYKGWSIESVKVEMNKSDENYFKWFARFLLEGKVFPKFKEYERYYNAKPSTITNGVTLDRKVFAITNALKNYGILDKEKLAEKWRFDKSFLLDVVSMWISDQKVKNKLKKEWPLL